MPPCGVTSPPRVEPMGGLACIRVVRGGELRSVASLLKTDFRGVAGQFGGKVLELFQHRLQLVAEKIAILACFADEVSQAAVFRKQHGVTLGQPTDFLFHFAGAVALDLQVAKRADGVFFRKEGGAR